MAASLGAVLAARETRADEPAPEPASEAAPWLEVTGCPPAWDRDLRRAIAVEIGASSVDAGSGPGPRPHTLSVRCDSDRIVVVAGGPATGERLARSLSRGELRPETATRVVALAAVELLAALDPALRRRLAAQAAEPPAATSRTSPVAADDRRLSVVASGVYRAFMVPAGVRAWGAALDGRRAAASGAWSIGLGVEAAGAERSSNLGATSAFLASVRASAGVRARLAGGALALSVDLGARAGGARLVGRSGDLDVQPSTVVRPWAGPVAALAGQLGVSWFCLQLAAEGGWAAVSATGLVDEKPGLAVSGPWVAVSLGIGVRAR